MVNFKGAHFVEDIILTCVRWYLASPLSYRSSTVLLPRRLISRPAGLSSGSLKIWGTSPHKGGIP
jgi:hypothetical protein